MTPGVCLDPGTEQETQPNPRNSALEISTSGAAGVENHASAVKPPRAPALFSVSLGLNGARHAFAIADTALAAHLDMQNLFAVFVFD